MAGHDNIPTLAEQVSRVPTQPGCYLWKDAKGDVIYVGKAKNLRARMRQYVTLQDERQKIPLMMQLVASFDYIVVETEHEALVLERNLIGQYHPYFNVDLKDAEGDIMKRKPRNAKDGVFAGNMGLDCVVQGLIITVLVLASFFVGVYFDMGYIHIADMIAGNADEEGVMMAFITLNMVEIFHCFNMRSRRASLFTMKKQNKWLWASAALALVLTVIVTVQPTLAEMFFGPVTLELKGVLAALGLAFLIIPLMEIYKAIMRAVEKE